MLSATLKLVAYVWLGVLVISTVILALLYVIELAARGIKRRRRSRS